MTNYLDILGWFRKKEKPVPPNPTPPAPEPPPAELKLTHAEEPPDPRRTTANTNVSEIINQWMATWQVPQEYWDFWRTQIEIKIYDAWPAEVTSRFGIKAETPAFTFSEGGIRHLYSLAAWMNPGVVAHEECHNSYALLTEEQKAQFSEVYGALKGTNPLIRYLYSINQYGLSSDVEGHAEIYRYLWPRIPEGLKRFYPKLG